MSGAPINARNQLLEFVRERLFGLRCRMLESKIGVLGIGSAVFVYDPAQQTRVLSFPDGIARHFSLSEQQWDVFDLWQQEYGTAIKNTFRFAEEIAVEEERGPEFFEKDLRTCFMALINAVTRHYSVESQRYNENDNGQSG